MAVLKNIIPELSPILEKLFKYIKSPTRGYPSQDYGRCQVYAQFSRTMVCAHPRLDISLLSVISKESC